jgi:hypothetical protein
MERKRREITGAAYHAERMFDIVWHMKRALICAVMAAGLWAQEREVAGVVKDAGTGLPLEGAMAAVADAPGKVSRSMVTGADGRFRSGGRRCGWR